MDKTPTPGQAMKQPFEAKSGGMKIRRVGEEFRLSDGIDWLWLEPKDLPHLAAVIAEAIKQIEKEKSDGESY